MRKYLFGFTTLIALSSIATAQTQIGGGGSGGGGGSTSGGGTRPGSSSAQTSLGSGIQDSGITSGSLLGGFNSTGAGAGVTSSNPFAAYYSNPYAAGVVNSSSSAFGNPVFGTSSTGSRSTGNNRSGFGTNFSTSGSRTTGSNTGSGGGRTTGTGVGSTGTGFGTSGTTGGGFSSFGNTGGGFNTGANRGTTGGGFGGTAGFNSARGATGGFVPPAPSGLKSGILYPTTMRFAVNPVAPTEVQSSIQSVVSRSTTVSAPDGVQVNVDSGVIVLRGTVANDDERRHVENLVRLSPGVRNVRNELTVR